ncbi:MAG: leucine-rich repeat protein [Clostridia bacterium]|nr:leucine-rich repeat protein [Clostridia bacterium]
MKKTLSILLSIILIISICPFGVFEFTASAKVPLFGECGENATFTFSNGVLTISGTGKMYNYEYDEGDTDAPWWSYHSTIKTVIIKKRITSIGDNAFYGCKGLKSITIPDSVKTIGQDAFRDCTGLKSITIPDSVTSIDWGAFSHCTGLKSITIPDSVKSIDWGAFWGCTGFKSITIPDSVKSIGECAFNDCAGLEKITVKSGNSVYHSAGNCIIETKTKTLIAGCKNSVIPSDGSVTSIGGDAFWGCKGLKSITIPYGVKSIDGCAFVDCTGLKSITLPDSVKSIGDSAFADCTGLKSVTIGNGVTEISNAAFDGCKRLKTVIYCGTPQQWDSISIDSYYEQNEYLISANRIYHSHSYGKSTLTKATLTKNGKTVKKCAGCGGTVSTVIYYPKTISLTNTTYYYNGKVKSPGVTVKNSNGKALKKGTDYLLSYSGKRKSVGEYSVTVKFKGNYSGKKTLKFKVLPKVAFTSATLCVKQTKKINVKSSHKVTYKSSNSKVASVDKKGVITAKKKGKATITVTSNKVSTKIRIKVINPYVKLNKADLFVFKGKSETLKATVCPKGAKVTWSSADKKIAKVSSKGKVTGVKVGKTTIKATIKYKGKTYQKICKVTVDKSKYRILKNYIVKNGTTNSDGNKMIGFSYDDEDDEDATYRFTIEYNKKKDCLVFKEIRDGYLSAAMSFNFKENQKNISVKMTMFNDDYTNAEIDYTLKVKDYYSGAGFKYKITTQGLLDSDDYKGVIKTFNNHGFAGWDYLLKDELDLSLNDIGFENY